MILPEGVYQDPGRRPLELIDRRHHSSSLIVTANRIPKDWYPLFTNPVIAESALDRLVSCAHVITLTGKSYRSLLRPNKDIDKEVVTMEYHGLRCTRGGKLV